MKGETYEEFVEKFKPKKTTDDCYTPQAIIDIVFDYVEIETGIDRSHFVRPFYPGGDYEHYDYKPDDIVVDNPPFSILSKIIDFYIEKGIKFFLFAPALTLMSAMRSRDVCGVFIGIDITYENGAKVQTAFITNLDDKNKVKTSPYLQERIKEAQKRKAELPKYRYPENVLTATNLQKIAKAGISYSIPKNKAHFISVLDCQKKYKKAIYGCGFLISDEYAREKEAREKEAREKEAREKEAREKAFVFELSDREQQIIESLNRKET